MPWSSGNVGLGTAAPGLDLSISTTDTPAIRLEQTAAGGFSAQTWDIGANEANFFVRDVTGGTRLPFRIRPGAPTSSIDIAASGNVGIGTASPANKLSIRTATSANGLEHSDGTISVTSCVGGNNPTGGWLGTFTNHPLSFFTNNSTSRMTIDIAGNVGVGTPTPTTKLDVNGTVRVATLGANPPANTVCFSAASVLGTCASDARLKHNVRYLQESAGLDAVMKLKPATFQWQDGDERLMAGFIAQETHAAIPAAVHKQAGSEFLSLDTAAVLSYAVRAIQELKADNDKLRGDIERLKASR